MIQPENHQRYNVTSPNILLSGLVLILHGTCVIQHLYHCAVVLHYLEFVHILVFIKIVNIIKQESMPTPHPVAGADGQPVQYYTITVLLKQCIFFKGQTQNDVWL